MSKHAVPVIGAVLLASLTAALPASAEIRTLTGSISGNPGSKLIIKVQRVGGDPFRIKSFEFKRVAFTCFGATPGGRISGTVGPMKVEKRADPFNPRTRTNVYSSKDADDQTIDGEIGAFIVGVVDRKATRTSGNIGLSFGDGCSADSGTGSSRFTAKR